MTTYSSRLTNCTVLLCKPRGSIQLFTSAHPLVAAI